MKKITKSLAVIILIITLPVITKAQFSFGLKAGVNFATISNYDNIDIPNTLVAPFSTNGANEFRTGYHGGIFLNFAVAENRVAFQPEVLFSNQGMKYTGDILGIPGSSFEATVKTDYINVPLMVQLNLVKNWLYIEAGPQVGFLVNSTAEYNASVVGEEPWGSSWDIRDDLNTVDFSVALGAGLRIPGLPVGVHLRYTLGVTNVSKNDNNDGTHNGVLLLGAFLKFGNNEN